jgi:hypothetical protein
MRTTRTFSAFLSSGSASKAALAASRPPSQPTTISFSEMRASPLEGSTITGRPTAITTCSTKSRSTPVISSGLVADTTTRSALRPVAITSSAITGVRASSRWKSCGKALARIASSKVCFTRCAWSLKKLRLPSKTWGAASKPTEGIDLHGGHDIEPGNMRARLAREVHGRRHEFGKPADLVQ